jgi:hypothetical protein
MNYNQPKRNSSIANTTIMAVHNLPKLELHFAPLGFRVQASNSNGGIIFSPTGPSAVIEPSPSIPVEFDPNAGFSEGERLS